MPVLKTWEGFHKLSQHCMETLEVMMEVQTPEGSCEACCQSPVSAAFYRNLFICSQFIVMFDEAFAKCIEVLP